MAKVLKNKKGVTLIELTVALMLFAIVASAASAILVPILKVYARVNELSECNTLLDVAANQIVGDLFNATVEIKGFEDEEDGVLKNKITIIGNNSEVIEYTIDDTDETKGVLLKNGSPVLSKTYYKNKGVGFKCAPASTPTGKAYVLTVTVLSDNNGEMIEMISRDYAVKPIAIPENQYIP